METDTCPTDHVVPPFQVILMFATHLMGTSLVQWPPGGSMKKVSLLFIGLLCVSVIVYAGEVITNDTGEDATGLRVVFSAPV